MAALLKSTGELQVSSSDIARVAIGSDRLPTEVTIFDHNLQPVYDGVTPVTQQLPPGAYEIALRSGLKIDRHIVRLSHNCAYDGTELGLALDTPVPISASSERRQAIAEAATTLSSKLHQSGRSCGLVLLLMNLDNESTTLTPQVTVLDSHFEPLHEFRELVVNASRCWSGRSAALRPGGYVIRSEFQVSDRSTERVDVPIWVSAGYQTLAFIPHDPDPRPDRMSIHMTPMTEIWTGFDTAANALELALRGWRKGRCLLAEARRADMLELVARNPMLGIVAAYSLLYTGGSDDIRSSLVDYLVSVVPDHPDVAILSNRPERMTWPPSIAEGYRRLLSADAVGRAAIVRTSVAEVASEQLLLLGPWTAWGGLGAWESGRDGSLGELGHGTRLPIAAADSRRARHPLNTIWLRCLTVLRAWRLMYALTGSNGASVAEILRTAVPEEAAVDRVRIYLSSVFELRGMRELRRIIGGRSSRRVAAATSLPLLVARQAVAELTRRIKQELENEIKRAPWKVDVQGRLRRVEEDIERAISVKSWRLNKPSQVPGEHWILPLEEDAERTPLMEEAEATVKATYCYIAKTRECLPTPAKWWQRLRAWLSEELQMPAYTSLHAAEANRVLLLSSDQLAAILPAIHKRATAYLSADDPRLAALNSVLDRAVPAHQALARTQGPLVSSVTDAHAWTQAEGPPSTPEKAPAGASEPTPGRQPTPAPPGPPAPAQAPDQDSNITKLTEMLGRDQQIAAIALGEAYRAEDLRRSDVRRFRNVLLGAFAGLLMLVVVVAIVGVIHPKYFPLCVQNSQKSTMICPAGGSTPSSADLPLIIGLRGTRSRARRRRESDQAGTRRSALFPIRLARIDQAHIRRHHCYAWRHNPEHADECLDSGLTSGLAYRRCSIWLLSAVVHQAD